MCDTAQLLHIGVPVTWSHSSVSAFGPRFHSALPGAAYSTSQGPFTVSQLSLQGFFEPQGKLSSGTAEKLEQCCWGYERLKRESQVIQAGQALGGHLC